MTDPDDWQESGVEPSLAEVMTDPIIHAVLRRDRLTVEQVLDALADVSGTLRPAAGPPSDEPAMEPEPG